MIFKPGRTARRLGILILLAFPLAMLPGMSVFAQTTNSANNKDTSDRWVNSVIASGANPEIINKHSSKLNVWQTDILRLKNRIESSEFSLSNQHTIYCCSFFRYSSNKFSLPISTIHIKNLLARFRINPF